MTRTAAIKISGVATFEAANLEKRSVAGASAFEEAEDLEEDLEEDVLRVVFEREDDFEAVFFVVALEEPVERDLVVFAIISRYLLFAGGDA